MDKDEIFWEMLGKFDREFGRIPTPQELNKYIGWEDAIKETSSD